MEAYPYQQAGHQHLALRQQHQRQPLVPQSRHQVLAHQQLQVLAHQAQHQVLVLQVRQ